MTRQSLGNPWIAVAPILRGASAGELVRAQQLSPTLTESDSEGGGRGPGTPGQQAWGNLTQVVMRPHFGAPQVSELLRSECWNWAGARLLMASLGLFLSAHGSTVPWSWGLGKIHTYMPHPQVRQLDAVLVVQHTTALCQV